LRSSSLKWKKMRKIPCHTRKDDTRGRGAGSAYVQTTSYFTQWSHEILPSPAFSFRD
jgi:hypothetical protein